MKVIYNGRSMGPTTLVRRDHIFLTHCQQEEPKMDLGVKLFYLIWCRHRIEDRQIHADVVRSIYPELIKTSPLFAYLQKKGVRPDDLIRVLSHEC